MLTRLQDPHPVVRVWMEVTQRPLSAEERKLFLQRTEVKELRLLLYEHGAAWMKTAAQRCLTTSPKGRPQLRLSDWVAECPRRTPKLTAIPSGGGPPRKATS